VIEELLQRALEADFLADLSPSPAVMRATSLTPSW
jgi:hypothetical protein